MSVAYFSPKKCAIVVLSIIEGASFYTNTKTVRSAPTVTRTRLHQGNKKGSTLWRGPLSMGLVPDAESFGLPDVEERRFDLWLVFSLAVGGGEALTVDVWVLLLKLKHTHTPSVGAEQHDVKRRTDTSTAAIRYLLQFLASFFLAHVLVCQQNLQ